jgi:hypothetical protein
MQNQLHPLRFTLDGILDLFGLGPRRSRFSPARNPESRMRFAQYVSRVQPASDFAAARRTARLLSQGGAVSHGEVRHAPVSEEPATLRRPLFHLFTQPGGIAARRRARAQEEATSLRTMFNALRVR